MERERACRLLSTAEGKEARGEENQYRSHASALRRARGAGRAASARPRVARAAALSAASASGAVLACVRLEQLLLRSPGGLTHFRDGRAFRAARIGTIQAVQMVDGHERFAAVGALADREHRRRFTRAEIERVLGPREA